MIRTEKLCLAVGDFQLRQVSLEVRSGEYFVLTGPTGSGKTLFIKCLCGLIRPLDGRAYLNGKDITELAPRRRSIGYVPQDCGLFPHMNVEKNITFSLRVRGLSRAEARQRIMPLIETLALGRLLKRAPESLSGGERQKVAVARALAVRPQLLLLDEPVSSLDMPTRHEVCAQLRNVQRQLRISTIHVCHSIDEAREVSDRVGILIDGKLVQTGSLSEVIDSPANSAVRRLLSLADKSGGSDSPAD